MNLFNNIEHLLVLEVNDIFTAKLNNYGIVEICLLNKVNEIEKEHLVILRDTIYQIGEGKKMPVFFCANEFLGITGEARKYAASKEAGEYTLANAVLIKSLANKLLFNFFLNINKPLIPTKGFNSQSEAFEWLIQQNNSST